MGTQVSHPCNGRSCTTQAAMDGILCARAAHEAVPEPKPPVSLWYSSVQVQAQAGRELQDRAAEQQQSVRFATMQHTQ